MHRINFILKDNALESMPEREAQRYMLNLANVQLKEAIELYTNRYRNEQNYTSFDFETAVRNKTVTELLWNTNLNSVIQQWIDKLSKIQLNALHTKLETCYSLKPQSNTSKTRTLALLILHFSETNMYQYLSQEIAIEDRDIQLASLNDTLSRITIECDQAILDLMTSNKSSTEIHKFMKNYLTNRCRAYNDHNNKLSSQIQQKLLETVKNNLQSKEQQIDIVKYLGKPYLSKKNNNALSQ